MSTSSAVLCAVLLAVTLAVAVPLARSAAYRWSTERSGRPYELAEDYRAAVLRAVASALTVVTGVVLVFRLPGDGASAPGTAVVAQAAPGPPASEARLRPQPQPAPAARQGTVRRAAPRTVGLLAGGILQQLPDGTRVWLPPQYARAGARSRTLPLVVAYLPVIAADSEQLYPAFAGQVAAGKADPFVVVEPRDCSVDPVTVVAAAGRYYRLPQGGRARAVLGVGALASCAVRAVLAHPDRFRAAAGVSGTYAAAAPPPVPRAAFGARPRLLLVTAAGEGRRRASALRLRAGLRRAGTGARVRVVDGVAADPRVGGGERRRELAVAARYLTEQFAGPRPVSRVLPMTRTHP